MDSGNGFLEQFSTGSEYTTGPYNPRHRQQGIGVQQTGYYYGWDDKTEE